MKKIGNKKFLVLGIIAILLSLAFTPITTADENNQPETIGIEVTDYLADGTTKTRIIEMSKDIINNLKQEIINTKTLEEKVQILKNYNILPADTKISDWEIGMQQKADSMGFNPLQLDSKTKLKLPVMLTPLKQINSVAIGSTSTRVGISPIIKIVNALLKIKLPRMELLTTYTGLISVTNARGLIVSHTMINLFSFNAMVGFVGTAVKIPFIMNIFTGYSVLSYSGGLGLHLKTVDLSSLPLP